jgi:hypothetical protein
MSCLAPPGRCEGENGVGDGMSNDDGRKAGKNCCQEMLSIMHPLAAVAAAWKWVTESVNTTRMCEHPEGSEG